MRSEVYVPHYLVKKKKNTVEDIMLGGNGF